MLVYYRVAETQQCVSLGLISTQFQVPCGSRRTGDMMGHNVSLCISRWHEENRFLHVKGVGKTCSGPSRSFIGSSHFRAWTGFRAETTEIADEPSPTQSEYELQQAA